MGSIACPIGNLEFSSCFHITGFYKILAFVFFAWNVIDTSNVIFLTFICLSISLATDFFMNFAPPWIMCSLNHLDTYKRDNILLKVYKEESRVGFTNLLHYQENMVIGNGREINSWKEGSDSHRITHMKKHCKLCRNYGISVAQLHRWKERFLKGGSKALGESLRGNEYQKEIDDLKTLVGDQALVIYALKKIRQGWK